MKTWKEMSPISLFWLVSLVSKFWGSYQDDDMVINCRKVYEISKSVLFVNYKNKKLDFLDQFNDDIMSKVDSTIRSSKLIAPKYISKII